jgi:hypothetical protein
MLIYILHSKTLYIYIYIYTFPSDLNLNITINVNVILNGKERNPAKLLQQHR